MSTKNFGSCLCGQVKFEMNSNFESFFLCHCQYCQKDTGSAHAANLFSSNANLNWLSGKELVKTFNLKDTRHIKSFCSHCGSALPSIQENGKITVVPAGCLDSSIDMKPLAHLFFKSKAEWDNELSSLPTFDTFPS